MKEMLLTQAEIIRSRTIKFAEGLDDTIADRIPEGFRNNIRWHLGHIYTIFEQYIFGKIEAKTKLPAHFITSFGNGTSPDDWNGIPASLEEITDLLQEQIERMNEVFSSKDIYKILDQPITLGSSFQFQRLSELITFLLFHEGNHQGFMKAVKKLSE